MVARSTISRRTTFLRLKRLGLADSDLAAACGATEDDVRATRRSWGVRPAYRRVDSAAAEVEAASSYYYSTWGEEDEAHEASAPSGRTRSVVILGSGPNRIGQGIEFDYCCVHAAQSFRALGFEAVMVNCNPETVSTDYDTSDRLYFEPLRVEEVLAVCEREQPAGVVIQFGGQTPLKLARALEARAGRSSGRRSTRSTSPRTASASPRSATSSASACRRGGWRRRRRGGGRGRRAGRLPGAGPPSYVLGGRNMVVCYDEPAVRSRGTRRRAHARRPLPRGRCRDRRRRGLRRRRHQVAAVMQHVEEAGVHSGDSSCVLPARVSPAIRSEIEDVVAGSPALWASSAWSTSSSRSPTARCSCSRSTRVRRGRLPFASKAIGVNLVDAGCRIAAGATRRPRHEPTAPSQETRPRQVSVKAAVLPFIRFPGADPVLGPEMRSTGEVMASAADFPSAFAKAERAAGRPLPGGGTAFLSVRDADKTAIGSARACARPAGLLAGGHRGHGQDARVGWHSGRARPQGGGDWRGPHGGRPRPPRSLRPRHQHAGRRLRRA